MTLTPNDDLIVFLMPLTTLVGALAQTHPDPDAVRSIFDQRASALVAMFERGLSAEHVAELREKFQETRRLIGPPTSTSGSN